MENPEDENETHLPIFSCLADLVEYSHAIPTWISVLPCWFSAINTSGKINSSIQKEFVNMARAADRWNQHCKEMKS